MDENKKKVEVDVKKEVKVEIIKPKVIYRSYAPSRRLRLRR